MPEQELTIIKSEPTTEELISPSIIKNEIVIQSSQFTFTGNGKEYFRIWIVNLCLTIATLGIYSAWAKVRRLQYFYRNTQLEGAVFNFTGEPKVILRGRIVAVIFLFIYHYIFGIGEKIAWTVFIVSLIGMPILILSALRFRLRNTYYRGIQFNFNGSISGAYATYLPVVLVFILPALIGVTNSKNIALIGMVSLVYLSWPWLHARIKKFQQGNFSYGYVKSQNSLKNSSFVGAYAAAFFLSILVIIIAMVLMTVVMSITSNWNFTAFGIPREFSNLIIMITSGAAISYLAYVFCGPLLQVGIWNRTWRATKLGSITVESNLPAWGYLKLQTVNVILTLLSVGLYRPFAVVRAYQYRLAFMEIQAENIEEIFQNETKKNENALGESSADFFGFDVSW